MTKLNVSQKQNQAFANEVSFMSIELGLDLAMSRNIIRWRMGNRGLGSKNRVWNDPKTGYPLSNKQWTGPAQRLADQVKNGTGTAKASLYDEEAFKVKVDPDLTWLNGLTNGMQLRNGGVLWDKWDRAMEDSQKAIERRIPAMVQSDE